MICDPCRNGGRWNAAANIYNEADPQAGTTDAAHCRYAAAGQHAQCEAPTTCACQHKVGQFVAGVHGIR